LVKRLVRIEGDEVECGWTSDINASIKKHPGRQAPDAEMWGVPFRKRSRKYPLWFVEGMLATGTQRDTAGSSHLIVETPEEDLLDGLGYKSPGARSEMKEVLREGQTLSSRNGRYG